MSKTRLFIDAMPLAERKMSGIGHLTLELTRALAERSDLEVVLAVPLRKRQLVARHGIPASIKTIPLPARVLSALMQLRILPPLDLLLGRGAYLFPNYRNWPLARSRSLTYIHDVSFALYPETVRPKNLAYLKRNIAMWIRRADRILTLSASSKADIVGELAVDEDKVVVVDCGVDRRVFYKRDAAEVEQVKQRYGIDARRYLLYVGNFEPRKNLERLLAAYNDLPAGLKNDYALLLVGGGGWLNDGTMTLISKLQKAGLQIIRPQAYVDDADLPALYSGATLLVHVALYEGFGLSPLQAMACGIPVVVSNSSSLPEVVGDAGVLANAKSESDISAKIQLVLDNKALQSEMSKKGLRRAERFSWKQAAQQVYDCLIEIG